MFLAGTWQTRGQDRREERRFQTPLGLATLHLEERGGTGTLSVELRLSGVYSHPGLYSALGALTFVEIPAIDGKRATFKLTAVPPMWLTAPERATSLLMQAGISAQIDGRSLVIRAGGGDLSKHLRRVGLALFALDPFVRSVTPGEDFLAARSQVIREFESPNLAEFLDDHSGVRALRALFDPSPEEQEPVLPREPRVLPSENDEPPRIETLLGRTVQVEPDGWRRAGETLAKWTVDPRWLFYLPPGVSTVQSDSVTGPLEHPSMALDYYRNEKLSSVIAGFKHSGSRAVVIVCQTDAAAEKRFGVREPGAIYSRTGRPFFENSNDTLEAIRGALSRAGFWSQFRTNWACLDGQLLPSSLKGRESWQGSELLLSGEALIEAVRRSSLPSEPKAALAERAECLRKYRAILQRRKANQEAKVRFAPLQIIATEGCSYFHQPQLWHTEALQELVLRGGDPLLPTAHRFIQLSDKSAVEDCFQWWDELSEAGAEGVVIRALDFVPRGRRGIAQPALLCRTSEHLRFVYGPEYDLPDNRWELANRTALGKRREKHRRVLKQLALSIEGVERFLREEEPGRIQSCIRAVMSLER